MLDTQMLIGANFVAGADAPEAVINPKTEETIVTLPDASPAQVDAAVEAAAKAFQTWSRTTPAERSGLLLKLADAIDRDAEAFAALEALNTRQAEHSRSAGRDAGDLGLLPLLRRRRAQHAWRRRRRIHGGPHVHDPPRPHWRRGLDRAVELSADDGGMEARAGVGGRQYDRAQAVGTDAADDAEACQDHRRYLPRGRGECRHRARRDDRPRSHQPPQDRHGVAHRQHRYRAEGAASGIGHDQAHASRARRQGPGHRVRRCRHRVGGRRPEVVRLLQCRSGLHGRMPRLCRQEGLRQSGGRPFERHQGDQVQSAE